MEKLDLKLDNSPRMRLSKIKHLARNNVASAELKIKEDGEVGDSGEQSLSTRLLLGIFYISIPFFVYFCMRTCFIE
jgi:hypothetical protein